MKKIYWWMFGTVIFIIISALVHFVLIVNLPAYVAQSTEYSTSSYIWWYAVSNYTFWLSCLLLVIELLYLVNIKLRKYIPDQDTINRSQEINTNYKKSKPRSTIVKVLLIISFLVALYIQFLISFVLTYESAMALIVMYLALIIYFICDLVILLWFIYGNKTIPNWMLLASAYSIIIIPVILYVIKYVT